MPNIDNIAKELQEKIMKQIKRDYSKIFIEHWKHPKNWGIMNNADGYAKITGQCGDTMEISINVKNKKIIKCTFNTDGCGASISCGSMITILVTGKSISNVEKITQKDLLNYCGGLPQEDEHCALLAVVAVQKAIEDYKKIKNDSWKKLYRKPRT
jgi:nitrogen fixation NifU-like protein